MNSTAYRDIFDKCKTNEGYFGDFRTSGDDYFISPVIDSIPGPTIQYAGKEKVMWATNDYLGLASHPDIRDVSVDTASEWGVSGPMGCRMVSGNTREHERLENELADYADKEASILFNFGYLGIIGTISSLVGRDEVIIMDKLCHASIVDAAKLAVSNPRNIRVFRHNDMNSLEKLLKTVNKTRKGGILILTEGVFSMTGDLAKLDQICELKEQYGARLFVDDAHGFGVMGKTGKGAAEHFGVQDKVDIYLATFAKAFAAIGGFAAASQEVIDWIRYNARTQIFAKSLPMVYVKSLQKTLEIVKAGDENRNRLFEVSTKLTEGLKNLGYFVADTDSPILSVYVPGGDLSIGLPWIKFLRENGVFLQAVMYPVIPKGMLMFRIIPTAAHTDEQIDFTVDVFRQLRDHQKMQLDINLKDVDRIYSNV
ncbi:pyridoxal phosphate-dependent aminotransferase family protein [Bacillus salacetis]|uniref:Pyridoxal phosphate-dependent aminotransferase family protein n=1 Tax=Bacillus salacetis TaxID=2315464 RepID=A0A3A1QXH9_9BACI|nr:pyridoxal phosphate-dependent aminotransferase family protein [Bacillus salacetis]RIW33328.1 pyridoxal phosphate-dependent aminotransferase family protein [Bacillus salacetis]